MPFRSPGAWGLALGAAGVLTLARLLLCSIGILLVAVQWLRELIRTLYSRNSRQEQQILAGAALILLPALISVPTQKALLPQREKGFVFCALPDLGQDLADLSPDHKIRLFVHGGGRQVHQRQTIPLKVPDQPGCRIDSQ